MVKNEIKQANIGMDEDNVFVEPMVQLIGGIWGIVSTQCRRVQFLSFSFSRGC
jgi:hypothetical protein